MLVQDVISGTKHGMNAIIHRAVLISVVLILPVVGRAENRDALDDALATVGMTRADLGWRPKGWWPLFPADIPYKLRAFDSLFAAPLDTVPYARALGHAARVHLDPATLNDAPARGVGHLFKAVHLLGTDPKFGAMRGYAANLTAEPTPLDEAILALHRAAGRPTSFVTFNTPSPYPRLAEELAERISVIPEDARPILGRLVLNIVDAHRWAELAFRNVDAADRIAVAAKLNLGEEQVDALDYEPAVDDVARAWDEASLWYAGEKCVQALDDARMALSGLTDVPAFAFDWETPWGWIRIRGSGADKIDGTNALLIVDLGGDDLYTGSVAASNGTRSIGLLLDLGGNDHYESTGPAQGAGMCGVGILLDAEGDDVYVAERYGQGVGQFGLGLCADLGGKDRYFVEYSGQGCGFFGIGLLLDADGDDAYKVHADGQGHGGVSGVGVLADRRGNDTYEAVRDARVTKRPSYHSPDEHVSVSNSQGCAMGRRGDGGDGHSWAGGLGALLDSEGDDKYTSGNWSMGAGYWFGTGILHDGGGDDAYRGVIWTQGAGAHFCIGALVDEGGNDLHVAEANSNMSVAFGHDFTIALLVNIAGDDVYDVQGNGLGYSINRSVAALIDVGGNDTYRGKMGNRPGFALFDERLRETEDRVTYWTDTSSLGLFLDVGGTDTYASHPPSEKDKKEDQSKAETDPPAAPPGPFGGADNTVWLDDAGSLNPAARNFSIGVDRSDGTVSFTPRPEKPIE